MDDEDDSIRAALAPYSRPPTVADLDDMRARIRAILTEYNGGNYTFVLPLCAQLFRWGSVEDALLIGHAKQTGWDAENSILIEWTCGAGIEPTRAFLLESDDPFAKHMLSYIDHCIACGSSFKDFDPTDWYYKYGCRLPTFASDMPREPYETQTRRWPRAGRHILAHYDHDTIIVYQAYRPSIADYAIEHQRFGGEFSLTRMSWIKPNFLWMMYRSGWGTKQDQERVLGLRLRRDFFDQILKSAVASSYGASGFPTEDAWREAVAVSDARRQWDPDHDPSGNPLARRAIQLGLRGNVLNEYAGKELLEVIDMTPLVAEQRFILASTGTSALTMPVERVYQPADPAIALHLKLDHE
jgi:hypothetical protein